MLARIAKPKSAKTAQRDQQPANDDGRRLAGLVELASADIETPMVKRLSTELHQLFDPVSEDTLPIYFGPLLGRLYLAGL